MIVFCLISVLGEHRDIVVGERGAKAITAASTDDDCYRNGNERNIKRLIKSTTTIRPLRRLLENGSCRENVENQAMGQTAFRERGVGELVPAIHVEDAAFLRHRRRCIVRGDVYGDGDIEFGLQQYANVTCKHPMARASRKGMQIGRPIFIYTTGFASMESLIVYPFARFSFRTSSIRSCVFYF